MSYVIGAAPGSSYTVVSGDTLDKIAKANGTTWQELARINAATIPNPNLIYPGQVILLSAASSASAPTPTPAAPRSASSIPATEEGMSLVKKVAIGGGLLVTAGVLFSLLG